MICNTHAISQTFYSDDGDRDGVSESAVDTAATLETFEQKSIASAVYPFASLINHSCVPNAMCAFDGKTLILRATRPLANEEQIFVSYGPRAADQRLAQRRKRLAEQYMVERCGCPPCTDPLEEYKYRGFRCQRCSGLAVRDGADKVRCSECGAVSGDSVFVDSLVCGSDLEAQAEQCDSSGERTGAIDRYSRCITLFEKVFHKHNYHLSKVRDKLAMRIWDTDPPKALSLAFQSMETVKHLFGGESIEYARELAKLGSVYALCGDTNRAQAVGKEMDRILGLYKLTVAELYSVG